MYNSKISLSLAIILMLLITSCNTSRLTNRRGIDYRIYNIIVESKSKTLPEAIGKNYLLVPWPKSSKSDFVQYSSLIVLALSRQGFSRVAHPVNAHMKMYFTCNVRALKARNGIEYQRTYSLQAAEVDDPKNKIWSTFVYSRGSDSDLTSVLPDLISATESYFGFNTVPEKKRIRIRVNR